MKKFFCILLALLTCTCAIANGETSANETILVGTVTDATMHSISIMTDDGSQYVFSKSDETDVSGLQNGLTLGATVQLTLSGDITGGTDNAELRSIADAPRAASPIVKTISLEGESESIVLNRFVCDAGWSVWYDANLFLASSTRDIPTSIVHFTPSDANATPNTALSVLLGEADLEAIFAENELVPEAVDGVYSASNNHLYMEARIVEGETNSFTLVLTCPMEAMEGYGARLTETMNTFQILQDDGRSLLSLYAPNADATALIASDVLVQDDPQGILDALSIHGAIPCFAKVLSFALEGDLGILDLSASFGEAMSSAGTAGETLYMGSVVNTFLTRYGLTSLRITCEGADIQTGHTLYDAPLSFMNGNP